MLSGFEWERMRILNERWHGRAKMKYARRKEVQGKNNLHKQVDIIQYKDMWKGWEGRLTHRQKSSSKSCCCLAPHEKSNLSPSFQFLRPLIHLDITFLLSWAPAKGNKHNDSFEFPAAPCSLVYAGKITTKKQLQYSYHYFYQKVWKHPPTPPTPPPMHTHTQIMRSNLFTISCLAFCHGMHSYSWKEQYWHKIHIPTYLFTHKTYNNNPDTICFTSL